MKLQFNGKAYGMDGVYWCMQFVWWCFQQVDKSLFMDGGKTAPCGELCTGAGTRAVGHHGLPGPATC